MTKVLLVGAGNVGGHILEFFARGADPVSVVVGDVDAKKAAKVVNNAIIGGIKQGRQPRMEAVAIDLKDSARTAELIERTAPDVIINCAVMQTWHRIRLLPEAEYARLSSATLGAWLPVQLLLPYRLSQAIREAGYNGPFINTSLSDLTNPALATVGMAPTIGIGNVDVIAPAIQLLAARQLGVAADEVDVSLVAHHVHWVYPREAGYKDGAPYHLRIFVDGTDVTDQFDTYDVMIDSVKLFPPGIDFTTVSATSAIRNAMALVSDGEFRTHAPGPHGLPGGYPVRISRGAVETDFGAAAGISEARAVTINEEAQRFDGIEKIADDGIYFTDYTQEIMADMLGFECARFDFDDLEERAEEQLRLYRAFEKRLIG